MKCLLLFAGLLAAVLASGCELMMQTDNTSATITDGNVSSFQTKQGNVIITAPPQEQPRSTLP